MVLSSVAFPRCLVTVLKLLGTGPRATISTEKASTLAASAKAFNIASDKTVALGVHSPTNLDPSSSLEIFISLFCFTRIAVFWRREKPCSGRYLPALKICYFEGTRSDAAPNRFLGVAISGCAMGQSTDRSCEEGVRYFWPS